MPSDEILKKMEAYEEEILSAFSVARHLISPKYKLDSTDYVKSLYSVSIKIVLDILAKIVVLNNNPLSVDQVVDDLARTLKMALPDMIDEFRAHVSNDMQELRKKHGVVLN